MLMHLMPRQSGKTTRAINEMRRDPNVILLVPNYNMKSLYPKDLQSRTFTADDFMKYIKLAGTEFVLHRRAILDEGLMYRKAYIASLYYELGRRGWEVISYATDQDFTPIWSDGKYGAEEFKREYARAWGVESEPIDREDVNSLHDRREVHIARALSQEREKILAERSSYTLDALEREHLRIYRTIQQAAKEFDEANSKPGTVGATTIRAQENARRSYEAFQPYGGAVRRSREGAGDTARDEQARDEGSTER